VEFRRLLIFAQKLKSNMEFFQQFRRYRPPHLVQPGDRLLLAVSGGLDSCVMLDLFCRLRNEWQKQWQWQLAVAHINHQIRGHEADEDEAFAKALAAAAGLPFSQRVEVPVCAGAKAFAGNRGARIALSNARSFPPKLASTRHPHRAHVG
jgi:tRNA(Ile)-lysidine synthase TilS/MesJ